MNAMIIYESLTGNTRKAATLMGRELAGAGFSVTGVSPTTDIDYQGLSAADIVILGSWTDGMLVVGQRPGRAGRLRQLPVFTGKQAAVFCTYAIDPGRTLDKMTSIVEAKGAHAVGGLAIRRTRLEAGVEDFVTRLLAAVPAR